MRACRPMSDRICSRHLCFTLAASEDSGVSSSKVGARYLHAQRTPAMLNLHRPSVAQQQRVRLELQLLGWHQGQLKIRQPLCALASSSGCSLHRLQPQQQGRQASPELMV